MTEFSAGKINFTWSQLRSSWGASVMLSSLKLPSMNFSWPSLWSPNLSTWCSFKLGEYQRLKPPYNLIYKLLLEALWLCLDEHDCQWGCFHIVVCIWSQSYQHAHLSEKETCLWLLVWMRVWRACWDASTSGCHTDTVLSRVQDVFGICWVWL